MNAEQYVARRASSYNLQWDTDDTCVVLKGHIAFPEGMKLTTHRIKKIENLVPCLDTLRVQKIAKRLSKNLEVSARKQFSDWRIPMYWYSFDVDFNMATCEICFTHKHTQAVLFLRRVFFDDYTGKILQAEMSFGK